MPTPEFILELRKKVGHDLLWLMGVSGYVEDEAGRRVAGMAGVPIPAGGPWCMALMGLARTCRHGGA